MRDRPNEIQRSLGESVVEEVRAIRESIDEEVGHDVSRLADHVTRIGEAVRREFGMQAAAMPVDPANPTA